MKMPPLFLGGCVLVGQIYFVYVKGFIGLYDCRTGRHIPFHVKSVFLVEVGKVFVVWVFRYIVLKDAIEKLKSKEKMEENK